jgi:hypothetical protein
MEQKKQESLWYTWIQEPFSWLVIRYLRPAYFQHQIEPVRGRQRVLPTVRLLLPIFLCIWLSSFLVRAIICQISPQLYRPFAPSSIVDEFLISALHTSMSCTEALIIVLFGGLFVNLAFSISAGLAAGFIAGLMTNLQTTSLSYGNTLVLFFGLMAGFIIGLVLGLPASSHSRMAGNNILHLLSGISLGLMSGVISGLVVGLGVGILLGSQGLLADIDRSYGTLAGAITGGLTAFFFFLFLRNLLRNQRSHIRVLLENGQTFGVIFAALIGAPTATAGFIIGMTGKIAQGIVLNWNLAPSLSVVTSTSFILSYMISYYRLPIYPISACSIWLAYRAARRRPRDVFIYLSRSALYWDERVFLSLPYLRHLLLDAAFLDQEQVRQVIEFIIVERPEQISEVRDACIEITLRELEQRNDLRSISTFERWFEDLFPQGTRLIDAHWNTPFEHFCYVSRTASRYNSPLSWQARKNILIEMENSLRRVHPSFAFESVQSNRRLQRVIERWLTIVSAEQEKHRDVPEDVGNLPNPYISGQAIQPDDPTFVGRRDLAQHLERALSREQYRPTFFLTGERRMGKSSTLNQLPNLLSSRYVPIVLDLQSRGKTSSASTFLWSISDAIAAKLESRGIVFRRLDIARLIEASRENEAAVYGHVERWLEDLDHTLMRADHVVLLAFDEFEKLEESTKAYYLNLNLLLDWFRSTIQHSKRLILLFSGVKQLGEMGPLWAGYFVNVETLRVSFLHPNEAYRLITRPTPQFPSEQIYSEGVVERLMEVTAHHPFLIQAICSKLIDNLNAFQRTWAELRDVDAALEQVLDGWWSTYFQDLWQRTDDEQRLCLRSLLLYKENGCDLHKLASHTQLDPGVVRRTLERLRQRDLVRRGDGGYRIASLVIERWVERNS